MAGMAGETEFKVFVFSLSLCTMFGGTGVEARSTYNLLVANANTLTAQLIFVFLSGAGIISFLVESETPCLLNWKKSFNAKEVL